MDKTWLAAQVEAGLSDREIGESVGKSVGAVGYFRRKYGIAPRPASARIKAWYRTRYPNGRRGPLASHWKGGRTATTSGYIRVYRPDHPAANRNGYVYEHRLVMEQTLGRFLAPGEIVDHLDRNRSNNAPENLALHESRAAHVKDHFSARDEVIRLRAENAELRKQLGMLD